MGDMKVTIGYLYPSVLSQYGDSGNVLCLQQRCLWRGIDVEVRPLEIGAGLAPDEIDLFFMGGGADFQQRLIVHDLMAVCAETYRPGRHARQAGRRAWHPHLPCQGGGKTSGENEERPKPRNRGCPGTAR